MHRTRRLPFLRTIRLLALCWLVASVSWATKTQRFVDDAFSDFQSGDTTTSTLSDQGYLTIPPVKTKVYSPDGADVFWDAAAAADGRVFLASGHAGKLFLLDKDSSGTLFAKTPKLEIYALHAESDGSVLVGGAPGGTILKVSSADAITTFSSLKAQYVWALRRFPGGDLYAATGTQGKVYKIGADGKAAEFCEIKQAKNVLDLAFDAKGALLAVTESKGMLVRIDDKGKAFVLYESDLEEIRRVAVSDDGDIWIAVNGSKSTGGGGESGGPGGGKTPSSAELAMLLGGGGPDEEGSMPRPSAIRRPSGPSAGGRGAPSRIILLSPEGFVRMSWTPPDAPVYDIVLDQGGKQLYIAAGNSGGLYRLNRLGHSAKITSVREKGLVRILRKDDGRILGLTNSPGIVYEVDPSRSSDGIFVSRAFDAQDPVRWGRALVDARVPSGAKVLFSTRSGNTSDPENQWGEWSEDVEVVDSKTMEISSPPARRIQYRLQMSAASAEESGWPRVDKVEVPFTAPNQPPEVKEIEVKPDLQSSGGGGGGGGRAIPGMPISMMRGGSPGGDSSGGSKGPSAMPGRPPSKSGGGDGAETVDIEADSNAGKTTVSWTAKDPNDDELKSKVYIRPEEDESWVLLDDKVDGNQYSLDSAALPDGRYRVRVVVADLPSNLPSVALDAEAVSDPFEVDNTPPDVDNLAFAPGEKQSVNIAFQAADKTTRIASAQWRINGKDWRFLSPADGIFDSKTESFSFDIPKKDFEGEKSAMVTVRATDERGNTGVGLIRAKVEP